jgi:hypothetical protein
MAFEFDPHKSAGNLAKHGIDFVDAQALWEDVNRIEGPARQVRHEERWLVVGRIGTTHWTAAITYRHDQIRIISVRRAHPNEIAAYTRG